MKKKIFTVLLATVTFLTCLGGNTKEVLADSYTYDIQDNAVVAPDAYEWERSVRGEDLGIDTMATLEDVYCKNGMVFIAMAGKVVITDYDFNLIREITTYTYKGEELSISSPKCVYVTADNNIYVTEEAKGQILHFDINGNCLRILEDPQVGSLVASGITYQPTKVCVDSVGRIYVKAKSVYEGIIQLDPDGNYVRFIGANEVTPSFFERFKRSISTEEQIAQMTLWLPTDYSDITMDAEGYIYATVRDNTVKNPIRKLNSAGNDVLTSYQFIAPPAGDYKPAGGTTSTLTNIAASDDGRFAALDATMSRVFVYGQDGILLYIVGGTGKQTGQLNSPIDITFLNDRILVADFVTNSIEVFKPTEYGELINTALYYQSKYDYETAASYWQQVYDISPSSIAANMGLGKYQLRAGKYEEALASFTRTGERKSWSSAFERVREAWLEDNLGKSLIIIIVVIILIKLLKYFLRRLAAKGVFEGKKWVEVLKKIKYTAVTWPKYMMGSPFKAFDDVKYEDAGSTGFAFVLLVLYAWVMLLGIRYKGFLVNTHDIDNINVPLILASSVVPFIIFVFANWAVGVLIDGKGNLRNVFKFTMYATYPLTICNAITIFLSRICIYEETGIIRIIYGIGWFLFAFYLFVGIVTIHQFSFTKGVGDVLLSAVGMAIVIFIAVLLASLVSGFINDVGTIIDELRIYT
ncbi:MAG: YIP1 family protein [Lachnospiraceae bacterium]|nr:YIP1 family protein [Lachnospiraceae bacterium]